MSEDVLPWSAREGATVAAPLLRPRRAGRTWRRRRPPLPAAGWRLDWLDSIHHIDAVTWDSLVGDGAITRSHAYLAAVEDAGLPGGRRFYAVLRDERGIVAHACVYLVETDFVQLMPRWVRALTGLVRRAWPRFLRARITECACPLTAGSSISLREGACLATVVGHLERGLAALAAREDSGLIVLRDFPAADSAATDTLCRRGFKRVANLPLARIRVRWPNYAAYLAALRGRYRKDLRRRLRRAEQAGRHVVTLRDFGADAARWAAQVDAVYAAAPGFKRERLGPAYYETMNRLPGQASRLVVVEQDGRALAHGMVLVDAENTTATFFGREPGAPAGEWFQLADAVIRIAIERGSRYVNFGLGAYDAKSLVGAESVPLVVYTRATNRLLNALIRLVPDLMRREPGCRRRVFRD
ncbi:MAG: GNAT family N-acetyltransferase [Gammaproteobacteria bacterium]|nr:GNAT family N-acetyltransferase [Gammaproteobacteria bacterium]